MASTPGVEPGPHWWEASALTSAQPLLPKISFLWVYQAVECYLGVSKLRENVGRLRNQYSLLCPGRRSLQASSLRGALATGREKEGELATMSLEIKIHLQIPCDSPSTEL